jgi:hypothetical protein
MSVCMYAVIFVCSQMAQLVEFLFSEQKSIARSFAVDKAGTASLGQYRLGQKCMHICCNVCK